MGVSQPWDAPGADPLADVRMFMKAAGNGLTYGEIDEGGWDAVQARAEGSRLAATVRDMTDCQWMAKRRAEQALAAAFRQACEEAGLAPHPGGECPGPDCRCEDLADSIEARVTELAAAWLGISAAELALEDP